MPEEPVDRIARFLADPGSDRFEELALAAFAFQVERIPAVRALAAARGALPGAVRGWREVPAVPALAFKSVDLAPRGLTPERDRAAETFRSSGSTGGVRSVHRHPFPELYRAAIDASFPRFCLPRPPPAAGLPMLALVPPRATLPDSSLSFMVDHALRRWGAEAASSYGLGAGRDGAALDGAACGRWARARAEDGRPGLVLATAFALAAWLDHLEAAGARLRLPAGTVVFETGGFKGRTRELSREELLARVADRLGVPAERVVREYGMTELTSQLYADTLAGGDPELFVAPHWVRVRVLDPGSPADRLAEAPPGKPGLIAVFDLANLSSAVHLLSEDLGAIEPGGLRLLGR
ncbi:MAG TPA: hypothetical protein VMR44_03525, partial [Thermoanaerobaculia bacterium]|nr:hypothetical protein [Thermoanaerobaculia bacterium]